MDLENKTTKIWQIEKEKKVNLKTFLINNIWFEILILYYILAYICTFYLGSDLFFPQIIMMCLYICYIGMSAVDKITISWMNLVIVKGFIELNILTKKKRLFILE